MVGKPRASRPGFGVGIVRRRMTGLRPGDVRIEVFQAESKLVAVDPFRPPSELRALQALNDEPEPLDLGLRLGKLRTLPRHLPSQVAHQPVQRVDLNRQRGEINVHAQDSNACRPQYPRLSSS